MLSPSSSSMVQMNGKSSGNNPEPTSENSIAEGAAGGFSPEKTKTPWGCNICHEKFGEREELSTHSSVLHGETYPAECRVCFRRFVSDAELGTHIQIKHIHGITISSPPSSSSQATEQQRRSSSVITSTKEYRHGTATHRRRAGHKKSRKTKTLPVGTVISSADSSVGQPPPPKKVKSHSVKTAGRHWCKICSLEFHSYDIWREHAVFKHIFTKNPYPIVEMNYVDAQSLPERKDAATNDDEHSSATTNTLTPEGDNNNSSSKDPTTQGKETIRMTICKNKGRNYIVKKSSVSSTDNETADESNSSIGLPSSPPLLQHAKEPDEIPVALEISQECDAFCSNSSSSPPSTNLDVSAAGGISMLERRLRRISRRSSSGQKSDISSERGDKENMPSDADIEHEDVDREQQPQQQQQVAPIAALKEAAERYPGITIEPVIRKVPPTTDQAVYLGTGSPDSDQSLVTSAVPENSKMVIVQTDDVHIAEDASPMEGLERLASAPFNLSSSVEIAPVSRRSSLESNTQVDLASEVHEPDEPVDHETSLPQYEEDQSEPSVEEGGEPEPAAEERPESDMISERASNGEKAMVEFEGVPADLGENGSRSVEQMDETFLSCSKRGSDREEVVLPRSKGPSVPSLSPCPPESPEASRVNGDTSSSRPKSNESATSPSDGANTVPSNLSVNNTSCNVDSPDSTDSGLHIHLAEENLFEDVSDDETEKSGTEQRRLQSPASKPEVVRASHSGETETDDFQCRVCGKNFTSDDEVKSHFSSEHFRVEVSSNILEPESPATTHNHGEMYMRDQLMEHHQRNREQALAHLIRSDSAAAAAAAASSASQSQQPNNSAGIVRPSPVHPHHQPMNLLRRPPEAHGASQHTGLSTLVPNVSSAPLRPPLSSAPSNFETSQQMRPRNNYSIAPSVCPPLTMGPMPMQRHGGNSHTDQQIVHSYPKSLHMALTSPNSSHRASQQHQQQHQQQQHSPNSVLRSPHDFEGGPRIVDVSSMQRPKPRPAQNTALPQGYYISQSDGVPTNLTLAHQQSRHHLVPRPSSRPSPQQQQQQQQHMSHQQGRNDPLLRLSSFSASPASRTAPSNLSFQQVRTNGGTSQLILGKRSASAELIETAGKQARIELSSGNPYNGTHVQYDNYNTGRPLPAHQSHTSRSQPMSPSNISPSMRCLPSPPEISMEKLAVVPVTSSNVSSVRLGNAITLSVCPSSEREANISANIGRSADRVVAHPGSQNVTYVNQNAVANALAVRGVTVTPASPPLIHDAMSRHKIQSNSPIIPTTPCSSPTYSVIQRAGTTSRSPVRASLSPPDPANPPVAGSSSAVHQFAIPRNPVPRSSMSVPSSLALTSTDRPDRPPTVDLTAEDLHYSVDSHGRITATSSFSINHGAHGGGTELGRQVRVQIPVTSPQNPHRQAVPPPRPVYACNQCNVLFNSEQLLEDHKVTTHGYQQRSNSLQRLQSLSQSRSTVDQNRPTQLSRHPPSPQAQLIRSISPVRSVERSPKNLYIPLLDLSQMDHMKLKRLEDMGISFVVPLNGNERSLGPVGIPVMSLRHEGGMTGQLPWDNVLPFGPVFTSTQAAGNNNH